MNNASHFRKPGQWKAFLALAWYAFKAQTRNPATFLFSFMFPVVFISVFGVIGNTQPKINVGIPDTAPKNNPVIETVYQRDFIEETTGSYKTLEEQLIQGKIAAIIDIADENPDDDDYEVLLTLSTGFPQEAASINALVTGTVDKINLRLAGVTEPPVEVVEQSIEGRTPRYIDFAVPGQIGFALLSTAIFGTVFGLIYLKKALILKRMFATPTKALTILLAQGTSRLIVALTQTVLILALAVFVFNFYLPNGLITFFELLLISVLGLIAFLGFGYFIAGLSNDENSASPLTNLVTLPQFLLAGTFFPIDNLPNWLQPIAGNLPLAYFNFAVRKVTTEGGTLFETWPYLAGLLVWGVVMYLLAARTFRWQ